MKEESLVVPEAANIVSRRGNYEITTPKGISRTLERDVDFGNPKKKDGSPVFPKPILFKAGAEKIIRDYNVFDRYIVESRSEDAETGYFYYLVKCSLVAYNPATSQEVVYTEGYGCANTRESKTGNQSGFDGANSALKKARKRAMVDAAVSLGALSSMFTADLEDTAFMESAVATARAKDDDPISPKQRQRVFAIASTHGMSTEQTKEWLVAQGFASVKDIKQADYDHLCGLLSEASDAKA